MDLIKYYFLYTVLFVWVFSCAIFVCIVGIFRFGHPNLMKFFVEILAWGGPKILGVNVIVHNKEIINNGTPAVLVGNHQSAIDLVIFGKICPDYLTMVMKKELKYYPFLGIFFMMCGSVFVDRKKGANAQRAINAIIPKIKKESRSLGFFPEGTRNRSGVGLLPFKKGAFHLAISAQLPIIPVVCQPISHVCNEKEKIVYGGDLELVVLPSIDTKGLTTSDAQRLSEQVREVMLTQLKKWETPEHS